jgi:hypothetical protein
MSLILICLIVVIVAAVTWIVTTVSMGLMKQDDGGSSSSSQPVSELQYVSGNNLKYSENPSSISAPGYVVSVPGHAYLNGSPVTSPALAGDMVRMSKSEGFSIKEVSRESLLSPMANSEDRTHQSMVTWSSRRQLFLLVPESLIISDRECIEEVSGLDNTVCVHATRFVDLSRNVEVPGKISEEGTCHNYENNFRLVDGDRVYHGHRLVMSGVSDLLTSINTTNHALMVVKNENDLDEDNEYHFFQVTDEKEQGEQTNAKMKPKLLFVE